MRTQLTFLLPFAFAFLAAAASFVVDVSMAAATHASTAAFAVLAATLSLAPAAFAR